MKNDPYIVAAFLKAREASNWVADGTNPIVTISRQMGALGEEIAYRTSNLLTEMNQGKHPWVVVDKDLGERVIADHHLPKQIANFFSGEQILSINDHLNGILGISTAGPVILEKMVSTIIQLARIGHIIFVGRAAHLITAQFPRSIHIRIVGSFDCRVGRIAESKHCSWDDAATEVQKVDEQRRHFASTYFTSDLDDSENFDMLFNTNRMSVEESAQVIAELVSSDDFRKQRVTQLRELRQKVLG